MSTFENIADKSGTICVGALAFALGDPSGGTLAATGMAGLAGIGIALRKTCARRACDAAAKATIIALRDTPDFAEVNLLRVETLLQDRQEHQSLNSQSLIDIARTTDGIAITLDRVDARTERIEAGQTKTNESLQDIKDDLRRLHEQHKNDPKAARDDLRDIAAELAHPKPHRKGWEDLTTYITDKVQELQATVARYEETSPDDTSANIRSEIARLLRERRYAEAQKLFDGILEMGRDGELNRHLQNAAFALEGKADLALLENRPEEAFTFLSRAADSFASIDPIEPARRRLRYEDQLYAHGRRYGGPGMTLAAQMNNDALIHLDKTTTPDLWAQAQNNLALALQNQAIRTEGAAGTALLTEAVTAYRDALTVHTRQDHPMHWATTQNNLAIALDDQAARTEGAAGTALLTEAVTAYRDALTVHTRQDHPMHWATTQNNLAIALDDQAARTEGAAGTALLTEAVTAYRDALTVHTRQDHPMHWATTQNNLAVALRNQATRTEGAAGTNLLADAITAYRDALIVRTRQDHPVGWATTQTNLANALKDQATRTEGEAGTALLADAITAFRDALTVTTRQEHPVHWAETQDNLAICELARADHEATPDPIPHLRAALTHVEAALTVFDPEHMPYNQTKATKLRDHLKARLAGA